MTFNQQELIEAVTALLSEDEVLSEQVYKFESGQPDVEGILSRLNGGQINVVDLGVKRESDLWRLATIGLVVSTRRPSINDSDELNTTIGSAIERILMANPKPGPLLEGVIGTLSTYEVEALVPIEGSPNVRVRNITVVYKIFR